MYLLCSCPPLQVPNEAGGPSLCHKVSVTLKGPHSALQLEERKPAPKTLKPKLHPAAFRADLTGGLDSALIAPVLDRACS